MIFICPLIDTLYNSSDRANNNQTQQQQHFTQKQNSLSKNIPANFTLSTVSPSSTVNYDGLTPNHRCPYVQTKTSHLLYLQLAPCAPCGPQPFLQHSSTDCHREKVEGCRKQRSMNGIWSRQRDRDGDTWRPQRRQQLMWKRSEETRLRFCSDTVTFSFWKFSLVKIQNEWQQQADVLCQSVYVQCVYSVCVVCVLVQYFLDPVCVMWWALSVRAGFDTDGRR